MIRHIILTGSVAALLLTGCVSTTTGPPPVESDDATAAESNYKLGREYFLRGNYERARDALERAVAFDPRMGKAHMTLGLTYEQLDIPRLATQHYELAVRHDPRNLDVRNAYAVFLCGERDYNEARKHFDRAIDDPLNDNPAPMMTNAGVCMARKPDNELAEQYFRDALDAKQNFPEALLQLTVLKWRTGDYLSSRAFLQRYMAVQPVTPSLLELAIEIEKAMGDTRAVREYRRQLIEEFPDSAEAQRQMETAAGAR